IDLRKTSGGIFTEADWNTTSTVDHNPYQYSKVAAERAAWDICKAQDRWDMVTINPSMVYGPALTASSQSASIDTMRQMGDGRLRTGVPRLTFGVVDVRDVARAHILAAFNSAAKGRYLLTNAELSMLQIAKILRSKFGGKYPFPGMEVPKLVVWLFGPLMGPVTRDFVAKNVGIPVRFDNRRSRQELSLQYHPVEQTLTEHFQQLLDDGLVKKQ
ncbi:MAG: NAD-dependent epimerase/dehydratase family protein, partial [Pseudomonadales bacterium]|nr:NAD-dependent epimerase/dehydratase family protein [Pseudomonadales bacterium]